MDHKTITIDTASPQTAEASVLIIYTGGTLGMSHNEEGYLEPFDFNLILDNIPSLKTFNLELVVISFKNPIDSSSMSIAHWVEIGTVIFDNYDRYDGFVILHGTDTMAYSASALSYILQGLAKPVIFTGAQLPITSRRSDARSNMIASLEIASARREDGNPMVPEVAIFFANRLLRGNRSKKIQSDQFRAFESRNYPELAVAGIDMNYNHNYIMQPGSKLELFEKLSSDVAVLSLFPGINEHSVRSILEMKDLKGVVLETFGSGNAPSQSWFLDALADTVKSGVPIFNVSQCNGGRVQQGKYKASQTLKEAGILSGEDITMEAAVTKMMHVLGHHEGGL